MPAKHISTKAGAIRGMTPTIGYVPISKGIDDIARLLIKKLQS